MKKLLMLSMVLVLVCSCGDRSRDTREYYQSVTFLQVSHFDDPDLIWFISTESHQFKVSLNSWGMNRIIIKYDTSLDTGQIMAKYKIRRYSNGYTLKHPVFIYAKDKNSLEDFIYNTKVGR